MKQIKQIKQKALTILKGLDLKLTDKGRQIEQTDRCIYISEQIFADEIPKPKALQKLFNTQQEVLVVDPLDYSLNRHNDKKIIVSSYLEADDLLFTGREKLNMESLLKVFNFARNTQTAIHNHPPGLIRTILNKHEALFKTDFWTQLTTKEEEAKKELNFFEELINGRKECHKDMTFEEIAQGEENEKYQANKKRWEDYKSNSKQYAQDLTDQAQILIATTTAYNKILAEGLLSGERLALPRYPMVNIYADSERKGKFTEFKDCHIPIAELSGLKPGELVYIGKEHEKNDNATILDSFPYFKKNRYQPGQPVRCGLCSNETKDNLEHQIWFNPEETTSNIYGGLTLPDIHHLCESQECKEAYTGYQISVARENGIRKKHHETLMCGIYSAYLGQEVTPGQLPMIIETEKQKTLSSVKQIFGDNK